MVSEEDQALYNASLSRTLRSFLNQRIVTPFPFLLTEEEEGNAYLSNVFMATESISSSVRAGTRWIWSFIFAAEQRNREEEERGFFER
jgi:hypothetical protein